MKHDKTLAALLLGVVIAASGCVSTDYQPPAFDEQVQTEVERSDMVKEVEFTDNQIKVTLEEDPRPEFDEPITVQRAEMNGEEQTEQPFTFNYEEGVNTLTIHSDEDGVLEGDSWDTEIRFNHSDSFEIRNYESEGLLG